MLPVGEDGGLDLRLGRSAPGDEGGLGNSEAAGDAAKTEAAGAEAEEFSAGFKRMHGAIVKSELVHE